MDDEATLITDECKQPASPPFVRAPLEDRSKYEKLAFNADETSSDSDKEKSQLKKEMRAKKKRRRVPGLSKKSKKDATSKNENNSAGEYESEDSIGSASDLKAMNDDETTQRSEKREKLDETISESVMTCGSSAYHAECESVATHEEDYRYFSLSNNHFFNKYNM